MNMSYVNTVTQSYQLVRRTTDRLS